MGYWVMEMGGYGCDVVWAHRLMEMMRERDCDGFGGNGGGFSFGVFNGGRRSDVVGYGGGDGCSVKREEDGSGARAFWSVG